MFYIIDTRGYTHGEFQHYGKAEAFLDDLLSAQPELKEYEPEIIGTCPAELAEKIRIADGWNLEDCEELCHLAGLDKEWEEADGNTFLDVVYNAADLLGVEI